jgi:hypothetical protein
MSYALSKWLTLMPIKWSYRLLSLSPSLRSPSPHTSCWLMSLEWLAHFEHVVQSLLDTCLLSVHFKVHIPLRYRFPNYCYIELRHVYLRATPLMVVTLIWTIPKVCGDMDVEECVSMDVVSGKLGSLLPSSRLSTMLLDLFETFFVLRKPCCSCPWWRFCVE